MKLLGIDYGRRRIGIAATDETGECIHGCTTLDLKKITNPVLALAEIITQESPDALIFGLPLGPRDEETNMSREIRAFTKRLIEEAHLKVPIHFVDESFSSVEAQRQLLFKKKKYRRNKKNVDLFAACNILESFQKEQQ
jgi:putative Holliday junction resolvase